MLKKLSLITFFITLIGFLPSLLLNRGFILIDQDVLVQGIPMLFEGKRMLSSGCPLWTWDSYFGDSWLAVYHSYPTTSPFGLFNMLFPYKWLLPVYTILLFVRYQCVSLLAYAYLRKVAFTKELSALGALMYTFSSWGITCIVYTDFQLWMAWFPLFLIAIENYIRGGRWGNTFLVCVSFLVFFTNWYMSPCTIIPGAIYALCRIFGGSFGKKRMLLLKGSGDLILGFCLSSVIIVPALVYSWGGARAEISLGGVYSILYSAVKIVWLFLPKVAEGVSGQSNAACLPVAGFFFTLLYLLRKRDWLTVLLVIMLVLYVTPLSGVFNFFTNPHYTRWAYALIMFFVIATLRIIEDGNFKLSEFWKYAILLCLAVSFCLVSVFSYLLDIQDYWKFTYFVRQNYLPILLLVFNLLFLYMFVRNRKKKTLLAGIVVCAGLQFAVCTGDYEFQLIGGTHLEGYGWDNGMFKRHKWVEEWHKKFYLDNQYPMNNFGFKYRTDFYYSRMNMGLLKGWPSVETYCSLYEKSIYPLLLAESRDFGKYSHSTVPSPYTRASFDALMSVKVIVDFNDPSLKPLKMEGLRVKDNTWNYIAYDYRHYIPMGYTYDSYVLESDIAPYNQNTLERHDVPRQMLANMVVRQEDVPVFSKYLSKGKLVLDTALACQWKKLPLDSLCRERKKQTCDWFVGDTHGFSAHVNMKRSNMLFFSVPADPGFTATVDGKNTKIYNVNLGLSAIEVEKGSHNIRFEFFPIGLKTGIIISLCSLFCLIGVMVKESIKVWK